MKRNHDTRPQPDTTDGVDLLVIIIFIILVCMLVGYVIGRH